MIHKKLLIGVASRLGGRLVCSTEGLIFQYIPTFTFVYVLFQLKEEKKRQSRKITAWPQPHFSPYPLSNFQNLTAASSPPSSDPLQPLKYDSTGSHSPGGQLPSIPAFLAQLQEAHKDLHCLEEGNCPRDWVSKPRDLVSY